MLTAFDSGAAAAKGRGTAERTPLGCFRAFLKTVSAADFILHHGAGNQEQNILALVPWTEATAEYFDRPVSSGSTGKVAF